MLHLITGVPGAKKTAFTVSMLDGVENDNKVNIVKNKAIFEKNQKIILDNDLLKQFGYLLDEEGTGDQLKQVITPLDNDYFDMFAQDFEFLRPDDYFKRSVDYNKILERITDTQGDYNLQPLLPVRTIYTNINNLKIDYVRANVYDWRTCPDGSIIVIDEVQLVEPYKETKQKDSPIVQELTIHRHRGFDFYFITQSAALLHVQIKDLIAVHYHLTLPYGYITKVYQYGSFRSNPNAVSVKLAAERSFSFKPADRIFKLYKSTTINTAKKRIPWKQIIIMIGFVLFAVVGFTAVTYKIKNSKSFQDAQNGFKVASAVSPTHAQTQLKLSSATASTPVSVASVPKPQQDTELQRLQQLQQMEKINYERKLKTMPSNVIAFGNNCTAYNTDGLPLDMSLSECKKYAHGKKQTLKKMQSMQVSNTLPPLSASDPI